MTQSNPTGPMNVGDFLVHEREDGQFALYDYESWRHNGQPVRPLLADGEAARVGGKESARGSGGTAWLNNWKTPGEFKEA